MTDNAQAHGTFMLRNPLKIDIESVYWDNYYKRLMVEILIRRLDNNDHYILASDRYQKTAERYYAHNHEFIAGREEFKQRDKQ